MKSRFPQFCSTIFLLLFASVGLVDPALANQTSFTAHDYVIAGNLQNRIDTEKLQKKQDKAKRQIREAESKIQKAEDKIIKAQKKFDEARQSRIQRIENAIQELLKLDPEALKYLKKETPEIFEGLENRY